MGLFGCCFNPSRSESPDSSVERKLLAEPPEHTQLRGYHSMMARAHTSAQLRQDKDSTRDEFYREANTHRETYCSKLNKDLAKCYHTSPATKDKVNNVIKRCERTVDDKGWVLKLPDRQRRPIEVLRCLPHHRIFNPGDATLQYMSYEEIKYLASSEAGTPPPLSAQDKLGLIALHNFLTPSSH